MDRRELISTVSLILGGTIVGASSFISGCKPKKRKSIGFSETQQNAIFEELAEIILPASNGSRSPGAKDVEVGKFMKVYVADCYNAQEQQTFRDGMIKLDELSDAQFDDSFLDLTKEQKHRIVEILEGEVVSQQDNNPPNQQVHYYTMMKQLAVMGYLSSEKVGTKVFRHTPIPGRYEGCIPYHQGEKAFI